MDIILEYASTIADISGAILDHRHGINDTQCEHIATIHRRALAFLNEYSSKQTLPVQQLRSYLNHDALSPVTVMIGYSEWLLGDAVGALSAPYRHAIEEMRDFAYALRDEIHYLHEHIWQFMQMMDIPRTAVS
ncbi:MAG: hypothetical protein ACOCXZ_02680 [Chloroflexota bacterium]